MSKATLQCADCRRELKPYETIYQPRASAEALCYCQACRGPAPRRQTTLCGHCGQPFVHPATRRDRDHRYAYCSPECRILARNLRRRQDSHTLSCTHCREPFEASRSDARYCSNACRQAAYRERPRIGTPVTK